MAGNYELCNIQFPIGENYSIGSYYSKKSNSAYIIVYNSNGSQTIYLVSDKFCDKIYESAFCMKFSAEPKHQITQFRCFESVLYTCKNWGGIRFIFTDGIEVYNLDVQASIATDSFTTPFFDDCNDPCEMVKLCVAAPYASPKAEYLPQTLADRLLPNKMKDKGFQYMYRFVNYDQSKSIYSDPSTFYFQTTKECFDSDASLSRCMKITLPVGNAKVSYIELLFRHDNETQWFLADRIPKYKEFTSPLEQWYERQLSDIIRVGYDVNACTFEYYFCNDKECVAVPTEDTNKVFNGFPREPQGLFPFGESIAFYNYLKGNCPLPKKVSDNIIITRECPPVTNCDKKYCNINVYAVIHDKWHDRNQFTYILEDTPDITGKTVWFGGLNKSSIAGGFETGWGQRFQDGRVNFVAQVRGEEDNFSEFVQHANLIGAVGTLYNLSAPSTQRQLRQIRNYDFWYQKCTLKVEQGFKGYIEIRGHDSNDKNTSTFIDGITNLNTYNGEKNIGSVIDTNGLMPKVEEIYVDTCGKTEIDLRESAFVIKDNAVDTGFGSLANGLKGYVKDASGNPLVGLNVYCDMKIQGGGGTTALSFGDTTDHNGFYHILSPIGGDFDSNVEIRGEIDCNTWDVIKTTVVPFTVGEMSIANITIDNQSYINNNYSKAVVKVNDCNGQPVAGVKIAISNGKAQTTLSTGEAIFRIRNFFNRARLVTAVLVDGKGCFQTDCNGGCNVCQPILQATAYSCFQTTPTLQMGTMVMNINGAVSKGYGLKSGGRYGWGVVAEGDCGVLSFVNKGLYIDIPKRCGGASDNCYFKYDFSGIGTLPLGIKRLKIVRTENINPFELQWIVDKAEYIDGKVKITIQSLNDYNFKNFFNTNTIYQYLKDDRIEFIADEKNTFFCNSLNYQILSPFHDTTVSGKATAEANYFNQILIEDDGRITNKIQPGTIIELQRPSECKTQEIFHTIGVEIAVVNGQVVNPIGIFNTFDTYIVNRKLLGGVTQQFEHHSPTDRWAKKVTDIGRAHIVNEFEDEKRYDRNIIISDADDFGSFGKLETTVGDAEQGGIVAVSITDDKILLIVHEHDNNIAQTNDGLIRIQGGVAVSASGDNIISTPQPKTSGRYGCQYDHIGSILFGDAFATWADVNSHAFIIHDYNSAKEASFGKIGTWTSKRFQEIQTYNNSLPKNDPNTPLNKFRFATGYNHHNEMVMLTIKQLRQSGIDNSYELFQSTNETISYRPYDDKFYGHYGFTPEGYCQIDSFDGIGCAFLTILHGKVWMHPIIPTKWGTFYGQPIDQVVQYCVNADAMSVKKFNAMELQSNMKWWAWKITSNIPNFVSEIPLVRFKKELTDKWNAAFLSGINNTGGLYSSKGTSGYWIKITLVRDNKVNDSLTVFDNTKRQQYDELNNIITKFFLVEQSGFKNNL
jgi:hypothetical protein